jgi:hypothetical protein
VWELRGSAELSHAEHTEHVRVELAERALQLAEERSARAVVEAAEVALELGCAMLRLQKRYVRATRFGVSFGVSNT